MAEVKGLTLKKVTKFKGHEGEPCRQGDIYLDGAKIGYYSDDFMMGPCTIDFVSREMEDTVKKLCAEFYAEYPNERWFTEHEPDLDEFMQKVISYMDYEAEYKRYVKRGFPIFAVYQKNGPEYMAGYKTIENAKQKLEGQDGILKLKFFTGLDGFNIK